MTTFQEGCTRIKPITQIGRDDLINLCSKQNWCTKFDFDEYSTFLNAYSYCPLNTKLVYHMAKLIYNYSDLSKYTDDYTETEIIQNIMFLIMEKTHTIFDIT